MIKRRATSSFIIRNRLTLSLSVARGLVSPPSSYSRKTPNSRSSSPGRPRQRNPEALPNCDSSAITITVLRSRVGLRNRCLTAIRSRLYIATSQPYVAQGIPAAIPRLDSSPAMLTFKEIGSLAFGCARPASRSPLSANSNTMPL